MAHLVSFVLLATRGICPGAGGRRHRPGHGGSAALSPHDQADLTLVEQASSLAQQRPSNRTSGDACATAHRFTVSQKAAITASQPSQPSGAKSHHAIPQAATQNPPLPKSQSRPRGQVTSGQQAIAARASPHAMRAREGSELTAGNIASLISLAAPGPSTQILADAVGSNRAR